MKRSTRLLCILSTFLIIIGLYAQPKVTVVVIIDQFAAHYIPKLAPYWHYGLHTFLQNGIVFTQAYQPHAIPSTSVGHTGLATGALPKVHGIVDNVWYTDKGKSIQAYQNAKSFALVPTINKQFLADNPNNRAIAISIKSRAALGLAGRDIPIISLSKSTNKFISNKPSAIIKKVLKQINRSQLLQPHQLTWKLAYHDPKYYSFDNIDNYTYASAPSIISHTSSQKQNEFLPELNKMPFTNKLLLQIAQKFIEQSLPTLGDGSLLVWVSLSSLDKVGHLYGPDSKETIDTLYHIDKYLGTFMNDLAQLVDPQKTLYVLTADHGVLPIIEILQQHNKDARRLLRQNITESINQQIEKEFGIKSVISICDPPFVVLNRKKLNRQPVDRQEVIVNRIIELFKQRPGISNVYRPNELAQLHAKPNSTRELLQNHMVPNRTSDIVLEIEPKTFFSKYQYGTGHNTPDPDNRHVPLIVYQPGTYEKQTISTRVDIPQVATTLQKILTGVPKATYMLPALPLKQSA